MSLPDDFKLTGSYKQQAERCGRMVPPLMMRAIAESIYEKVIKPYNEISKV
jgi:DNA (cytosine-5)-methyltransferase 1